MQWAVVRLSNFLNPQQIAMCLALSPRSVRRIISYFRAHGSIIDDEPAYPQTQLTENRGFFLPYGYPAPIIMPPYGLLISQGHAAIQYVAPAAMSNTIPSPSQSHTAPPSLSSSQSIAPHVEGVEIPNIDQWFRYLDQHSKRKTDGLIFSPYGAALKAKGFFRISQLASDFFEPADLAEWIGVEPRAAALIMDYAKTDLEALKSGTWVFPKDI